MWKPSRLRVSSLITLVIAGCGAAEIAPAAPTAELSALERYFPAAEGSVWSYDVDTGEPLKSLVITRVVMRQGEHFALSSSGSEPVFYQLREDGIFHLDSGSYLLKLPLEIGTTWRSRGGVAEIVEVGTDVRIEREEESAHFSPCVVVEERGRASSARIRTTYCEGVGVVRIETELEAALHPRPTVATLRGHLLAEEAAPSSP